jgi:TPR repeat protein
MGFFAFCISPCPQRVGGEDCGEEAFGVESALFSRKSVLSLSMVLAFLVAGNCFAQGVQLKATTAKGATDDAQAQFQLGVIYEFGGEGVAIDVARAANWYRKAAEQGLPRAQYTLGRLYVDGEGVPQDYQQAVHWLRKAAAQNYVLAWNRLGVMYERGQGVPRDDVEAFKWFSLAAQRQNIAAVVNLENLRARLTEAQILFAILARWLGPLSPWSAAR